MGVDTEERAAPGSNADFPRDAAGRPRPTRGTWKSPGPSQLTLGPLALTRAMCPPGSLHDRIVKDWSFVRAYVIKDGHLFLALMADGGIYEFEPMAPR